MIISKMGLCRILERNQINNFIIPFIAATAAAIIMITYTHFIIVNYIVSGVMKTLLVNYDSENPGSKRPDESL